MNKRRLPPGLLFGGTMLILCVVASLAAVGVGEHRIECQTYDESMADGISQYPPDMANEVNRVAEECMHNVSLFSFIFMMVSHAFLFLGCAGMAYAGATYLRKRKAKTADGA